MTDEFPAGVAEHDTLPFPPVRTAAAEPLRAAATEALTMLHQARVTIVNSPGIDPMRSLVIRDIDRAVEQVRAALTATGAPARDEPGIDEERLARALHVACPETETHRWTALHHAIEAAKIAAAYRSTSTENARCDEERLARALPSVINFRFLPPRAVDDPIWREVALELAAAYRDAK